MKHLYTPALWALLIGPLLVIPASAQELASVHDTASHAGAGLNKSLTAGLTKADFLKLGAEPQTVKVTLIAAFTDDNYGMNFDGFSHGRAAFTIPVGWKVEVTFINPSPVPHSVIVVDREDVRKIQLGAPAFAGGSTPNALIGLSSSKATFVFTASEAGDYAFACGFPSHAAAGHWVALKVAADIQEPSLKLGDEPAQIAK